MIQNNVGVFGHEGYISSYSKFYKIHVILKTITRTRMLKGGGFGLTVAWAHVRHALHIFNAVICCNYDFLCISIG